MSAGMESSASLDDLVDMIGSGATARGLRIAVAESLTSGNLAARLGAGAGASDWFVGGVVAYDESVKFGLLGVPEGPVVSATCAEAMARGVRRVTGADLAVAVTGVGGPEPSEGHPAGTVFVAIDAPHGASGLQLALDGGPDEVLHGTVAAALAALEGALRDR